MPWCTAVFTMVEISHLSKQLARDFPAFTFVEGDSFSWSPNTRTITFNLLEEDAPSLLLHELGHAHLGHTEYLRDIALLGMETDAWQQARVFAKAYKVTLDDDQIESHLDTYREWLHKRSLCPSCEATGLQVGAKQYRCLACDNEWRVNEARLCALRRYSKK